MVACSRDGLDNALLGGGIYGNFGEEGGANTRDGSELMGIYPRASPSGSDEIQHILIFTEACVFGSLSGKASGPNNSSCLFTNLLSSPIFFVQCDGHSNAVFPFVHLQQQTLQQCLIDQALKYQPSKTSTSGCI